MNSNENEVVFTIGGTLRKRRRSLSARVALSVFGLMMVICIPLLVLIAVALLKDLPVRWFHVVGLWPAVIERLDVYGDIKLGLFCLFVAWLPFRTENPPVLMIDRERICYRSGLPKVLARTDPDWTMEVREISRAVLTVSRHFSRFRLSLMGKGEVREVIPDIWRAEGEKPLRLFVGRRRYVEQLKASALISALSEQGVAIEYSLPPSWQPE